MSEKLYKRSGMLTLWLVMLTSVIFAQERSVSGAVKDTGGNGIPGVNIVVKGTSTGTTTDADGSFKITINENTTLVFSFIGYANQEVEVGSQTTIDVSLLVNGLYSVEIRSGKQKATKKDTFPVYVIV